MVHGDCSSRGCYAMTDEQMSEIYALGRESFFGGQRSFQVQAYPFRMTAQNMAKHRNNPNMPFWKMLKQGNDHFEVTQLEPKVDVCEQRYVFNAEKDPNSTSTRPLNFSPAGKCPAYVVQDDIAQAVAEKQRKDEYETAELITRGTPSVAARKGIDGGMHPLFAAKTPNGNTGLSDTKSYTLASYARRAAGAAERQSADLARWTDRGRHRACRRPVAISSSAHRPRPAARAEPAKQQAAPGARRLGAVVELRRLLLQPGEAGSAFGGSDTTASTTRARQAGRAAAEAEDAAGRRRGEAAGAGQIEPRASRRRSRRAEGARHGDGRRAADRADELLRQPLVDALAAASYRASLRLRPIPSLRSHRRGRGSASRRDRARAPALPRSKRSIAARAARKPPSTVRLSSSSRAAVFMVSPLKTMARLTSPISPTITGPKLRLPRIFGAAPNLLRGAARRAPASRASARKQRNGRASTAPTFSRPGDDQFIADIAEDLAVIVHHRAVQQAKGAVEKAMDADAAQPFGETGGARDIDEQHEAVLLQRLMVAAGEEVDQRARAEQVRDLDDEIDRECRGAGENMMVSRRSRHRFREPMPRRLSHLHDRRCARRRSPAHRPGCAGSTCR